MLGEVAVVIPARDEESTIQIALEAVYRSAARLPVSLKVSATVVANGCSDRTADRARSLGATVLETEVANVGAARATGVASAIGRSTLSPAQMWIATTDADSAVPEAWLTSQIEFAVAGADMFLGTVTLSQSDADAHPRWFAAYAALLGHDDHKHIHGASLGFRASTYLRVGGFRPLPCHEDVDLVDRFRLRGSRIARSSRIPVLTSARHDPRTRGGVGSDLAEIAQR